MTQRTRFQRSHSAGFTLVELLAVIAIIGLLIGILVPSIAVIRTKAKTVATRATIASLAAGIEAYRAENRLGGGYPPSSSDGSGGLEYKVTSPYGLIGISADPFDISGAGLLVWALSGADLLGTPGFRTFRSGGAAWAEDTHDTSRNGGGAYWLDPDTLQPKKARYGPYVDDEVRISTYSDANGFEIEAETEARAALGEPQAEFARNYPMYLDAFGFPLLYYRLDPAGIAMYDFDPSMPGGATSRGFYHARDNDSLVKEDDPDELILAAHGQPHNMEYVAPSGNQDPNTQTFGYFIWNQSVAARKMPHNAQTYLLFSPGPDGRYGTSDDIGNFTQSGG